MWLIPFARKSLLLDFDMTNLEQLSAELAQMHAWLFQSLSDQPDAANLFETIVSQYESSIPVNDIPRLRTLLAVKLRHQPS